MTKLQKEKEYLYKALYIAVTSKERVAIFENIASVNRQLETPIKESPTGANPVRSVHRKVTGTT